MPENTGYQSSTPVTFGLIGSVRHWIQGQHRASRRQLMLDQDVQGKLIGRVVLHWVACIASITLAQWCWGVWTDPNARNFVRVVWDMIPAAIGSLVVLPLAIADVLRLSNRFVGPILRLRNAMKQIEIGDQIPPLEVRQNDMWKDVALRFNRLRPITPPHEARGRDSYTSDGA